MDNKATATEIGKRVQTLREGKGISRREFALSVGIPLTSYRDREMGRLDFTLAQLRSISARLGVDVDTWFRDLPRAMAA